MSAVFVVQKPKPGPGGKMYDISPAINLGQFVFVFDSHEQPGLTPGPSMNKARKILKDFCNEDYILWAGGDPAALAVVTLVASDMNHGVINFLRWERERNAEGRTGRGYYMPVRLNVRG